MSKNEGTDIALGAGERIGGDSFSGSSGRDCRTAIGPDSGCGTPSFPGGVEDV